MFSERCFSIFACPPLQADEGPEQEGGHSETQGASGEEQERPADGRGPKARGQHHRKLSAGQGNDTSEGEKLSPSTVWIVNIFISLKFDHKTQ